MADVDTVINNATALAASYADSVAVLYTQAYNAALENNLIQSAPLSNHMAYVDFPGIATGPQGSEIPVFVPQQIDPTTIVTQFDSIYAILKDLAITSVANFLATYIENDPVYAKLLEIINENGSIEAIAAPMWNQAAVRAATDNYNAQVNVLAITAGRAMPLPPGAQNGLLAKLALDYNTKQQEINIAATVENIKLQVSHLEFALKTAADFKLEALKAAVEYARAVMVAPDIASRFTHQISDLQSNLINAVSNLYRARLERDDLFLKKTIAQNDLRTKHLGLQIQNIEDRVKEQVNAAVGSMNPMAHVAASALSQINAMASKIENF